MTKPLALSLALAALLPSLANASDAATASVRAELESELKQRAASTPKEITPGCVRAPLPTAPTGPVWQADIDDTFFGPANRFSVTVWRADCGGGDHQLLVTLEPITAAAFVSQLFHVRQGSRSYNSVMVLNDNLQPFSGDLTRKTTVMLSAIGGQTNQFDDDEAMELQYLGLLNPTTKLQIPAAGGGNSQPDPDFVLDGRVRGTFAYADGRDGQGFLVDVDEPSQTFVGALFTGHPTVANQLDWYTFNGPISGEAADLTIFKTSNVRYGQVAPGTTAPAGTGRIEFESCTEARITLQIGSAAPTTHTISRLTAAPDGC